MLITSELANQRARKALFTGLVYTNEDYTYNMGIFDRGHLTPNGDFSTDEERKFTMRTTNIAPQRSAFNTGNWAALERALRQHVTETKHALYIITGTGIY